MFFFLSSRALSNSDESEFASNFEFRTPPNPREGIKGTGVWVKGGDGKVKEVTSVQKGQRGGKSGSRGEGRRPEEEESAPRSCDRPAVLSTVPYCSPQKWNTTVPYCLPRKWNSLSRWMCCRRVCTIGCGFYAFLCPRRKRAVYSFNLFFFQVKFLFLFCPAQLADLVDSINCFVIM